jgi:hypothetical protein
MHLLLAVLMAPAATPVLKHSDVVFMYAAPRSVFTEYGATVLAWGGTPTPESLAEAKGVRCFGSVGMVTEFASYYERFPDTYEQGLCRDVNGQPVKVPWLTDHKHKGIPYWWCCTNQPTTRTYLEERVVQTIKAGADGLHIDDHLGTSGGLWLGICFCDRCIEGFRGYLSSLTRAERDRLGIKDASGYDFRAAVRQWLAEAPGRKVTDHPLWPEWEVYQCHAAASFMKHLRSLAARTAGKPVPVAANAGLLWPRHLADYEALDMFSAETDHHAEIRKPDDAPVLAYRLAEAVGRPYASTASGGDWAFIKEHNLPGLVRCWIALSYAAGQRLMAPYRQWCYTPEKGTHWYDGPTDKFAPLYRFVRENAGLFDGYETLADVTLLMPHGSFVRDPGRWISMGCGLSAANVSYSVILAGDRTVPKPLSDAELRRAKPLVALDTTALEPADSRRLQEYRKRAPAHAVFDRLDDALAAVTPAVRITSTAPVRAFPRVKPRSAVVHLVNYAYDATRDDVTPQRDVIVTLDLTRLGVRNARRCTLVRPGMQPESLSINAGRITVPQLDLWAILKIGSQD